MKSIRSAFTRPTPMTDVTVEPLPCAFPFSAEADGLHYCWRGEGPNKKSTSLSVYECCTELWTLMPTTGPAHPGTSEGCSVCIGTFLFLYGGWNGSKYFNDMSKLDLNTLQWSTVQTTGSQPIRKFGCGLVRVDERTLCCIGGYGKGPKQPGSKFCRNFDYFDGTGWTDEINLFDVQDGNWSVPEFRGERPPPCSNFTFTKVDQYRAVYFGGMVAGGHMVNTLYLIDFRSMTITKMEPVKGEPWPVNRCTHSACCLNYGGNHPQLLVYGGMGCSENILKDMWVLDVDSGKWTEITLPESMKPRRNHSLTATSLGPGLTEVLLIGGKQTWLKSSIAKTTIFRFECSVFYTGKWFLADVVHNDTRGSTQRLTEKNRIISQAKAIDQSSLDRVRALEEQLQAAELKKREIQQELREPQQTAQDAHRKELATQTECHQLLREKDQELTAKNQELVDARDDAKTLQEDLQTLNRRAQLAEKEQKIWKHNGRSVVTRSC